MRVIDAQLEPLPSGGILYDAARMRKPTAQLFSRAFWAAQGSLREVRGGRGSVYFVRPDPLVLQSGADESWVVRHYRRGGLVARVLGDRYLWTGAQQTRCFREWSLLAELRHLGLPVPEPVAAMYVRSGWSYRADLITVQLPDSRTLAELLATGPLERADWTAIGRTLAQFHAQGVQHADLNAHNILIGAQRVAASREIFVLDFDRGRFRERGAWEQSVFARLHRSLEKVTAATTQKVFGPQQWQWLLEGSTLA